MCACDVIIAVYLLKTKPVPPSALDFHPQKLTVSGEPLLRSQGSTESWEWGVVMIVFLGFLVMSQFSKAENRPV